MVSKAGVALKGVTTFLRAVEFLGSALVLGICSYWLAVITRRDDLLPTWMKAVEGMAGGAVIYTGFAVILTIFLGGFTFFAFLAVLLDVLFLGAFIAIAILTRGGTRSCSGPNPDSVLGPGNRTSCRLETAVFAVAIIMALCFLISALLQVLLSRQHKKEKRYGPSPSNNYTSGSGKKQPFWKRKRAAKTTHDDTTGQGAFNNEGVATYNGTATPQKKQPFWKRNKNTNRDAEMGMGAAGASALITEEKHKHNRDSGVTGTTAGSPGVAYGGPNSKYSNDTAGTGMGHGQYDTTTTTTAPAGTYQPYSQGAATGMGSDAMHNSNQAHYNGAPMAVNDRSTFGHGNY